VPLQLLVSGARERLPQKAPGVPIKWSVPHAVLETFGVEYALSWQCNPEGIVQCPLGDIV
jgi:hypothetical protein